MISTKETIQKVQHGIEANKMALEENELPKIPKGIVRQRSTRLFRFKKNETREKIPSSAFRFNFSHDSIETSYNPISNSMSADPSYEIWLYGSNMGLVGTVTKKDVLDMLKIIEETEKLAGKNISLEQKEIEFN